MSITVTDPLPCFIFHISQFSRPRRWQRIVLLTASWATTNAVSLGEQVNVSGLNINEEDVLVADADGITKIENEILNDIIKVCEEVRKDEARTQKFFSVKDKTRYKSWTTQGYT